jgi:hypothetical protein
MCLVQSPDRSFFCNFKGAQNIYDFWAESMKQSDWTVWADWSCGVYRVKCVMKRDMEGVHIACWVQTDLLYQLSGYSDVGGSKQWHLLLKCSSHFTGINLSTYHSSCSFYSYLILDLLNGRFPNFVPSNFSVFFISLRPSHTLSPPPDARYCNSNTMQLI